MPSIGITAIGIVLAISVIAGVKRFVSSGRRRAELLAREARKQERAAETAKETVRSLMQGLAQQLHFALSHAASQNPYGDDIGVRILETPNIDSWFSVVAWYRPPDGRTKPQDVTLAGGESGETILTVVFDGRRERGKVIEVEFRGNLEEEGAYFHDEDIDQVIRICREQILGFQPQQAA